MSNKKAQADMRELIITLVIVGILFIVGVMIFAKVKVAGDNLLSGDRVTVTNESVTITANAPTSDNSTLLAQAGYIEDTETVKNATAPFVDLTRDIEYKITLIGNSGDLTTRANFTLLNITDGVGNDSTFNASALTITYERNRQSASQATADVINTTVLDSFELGVIALIILAAVAILAILFKLGSQ